ncbi:MAG: radical SAM protein [Elusimicrobia bacterium]|nr:radical SAM protein [Elusimicrobiota bacterium]
MKGLTFKKILSANPEEIDKKLKLNHLFIYINTSCNLSCRYCGCHFINELIKNPILQEDRFRKALKQFAQRACRYPEFTFYGGEPLIYYEKLKKYSSLIRSKFPYSRINIFTNGMLLNKKAADLAEEKNLNFLISIDGDKKTTDFNRKTFIYPSVYEKILKNLKNFKNFHRFTANMVITPDNVEYWADNVAHLKKMGFESVNWDINYAGEWDKKKINIFSEELIKILSSYIKESFKKSNFKLSNLYKYLFKKNSDDQPLSLTLMNDGNFYFCDLTSLLREANQKELKKTEMFFNFLSAQKNLSRNELYCGTGLYLYLCLKNKKSEEAEKKLSFFFDLKNRHEKILKAFANKIKRIPHIMSVYEEKNIK